MEGHIGGIALPTNVTLGKCKPSMLCVVDVYLTNMTENQLEYDQKIITPTNMNNGI